MLAPGNSYPSITVTVSVAANAMSPQVNSISVTTTQNEGNSGNNTANDSTIIVPPPDLTVTKSHTGNFSQGQAGAVYSVTVNNAGPGNKPAGSLVSLVDTPPPGLTVYAMSGAGWTCTTLPTCTRSDLLAAGASYPAITVTVTVAANAISPQVNSVAVSTAATESNTGNNSANDSTIVVTGTPGPLTVTRSGSGTGTVSSLDGGINCGSTCTHAYGDGSNITLTATPAGNSVFTGWLGPCTGTGPCVVTISGVTTVSATFALSTIGTHFLDIDANSQYDALTDGLMAMRYLLGLTGTSVTTGAVGPAATRSDPTQIGLYLNDIRPYLDVDGNGVADALTDGLLIIRALFGLTGTSLIQGAIGAGATRTSAAQVESYLTTLK